MIRVLSTTVYEAESNERLYFESFTERYFGSDALLNKWIDSEQRRFAEMFKCNVKVYPVRRYKPMELMNMIEVVKSTARAMDQHPADVLGGKRLRKLVDVRMVACMILLDADYTPMEIEKMLPFKNRVIYYYRETMENRFATERGFEDHYEEIKKQVMDELCGSQS